MLVNPLIFLLMQDAPAKPLPALGLISCCGYHPTFTKHSSGPRIDAYLRRWDSAGDWIPTRLVLGTSKGGARDCRRLSSACNKGTGRSA